MTGIEAIANGVKLFRQPATRTRARATMLVMGLMARRDVLLRERPRLPLWRGSRSESHGCSALGSPLLWALQLAPLLILVLAANTAFAGFPRLAAMLAQDHFLPRQMGWLGDRLVFQNGITTLVLATA